MDRNDTYKYFTLQAHLYMAMMNWLNKAVKSTEFEKQPYKIKDIILLNGGIIDLKIEFVYINADSIIKHYEVKVEELEEF